MSTNPMRRGLHGSIALCLMATAVTAQSSPQVTDAVLRGDLAMVRTVLRAGADVNATQGDGMTALHWAAHNGHADMARVLIYAGGNLRATTRMGDYTPLILASANGHAEVIDALLQAGADANATTSTGTTPLHLAAAAGSAEAVSALLDHGADVNVVESVYEQTPLMFAASSNRTDAMAVLIDRGADLALATKVVQIADLTAEATEERRVRNARVKALRQAMEAPARNDGRRGGRGGGQRGGARGQQGARGAAPAQGQTPPAPAQRGARGGGQRGAAQTEPPAGGQRQGRRGRQRGGAQADPQAAQQRGRGPGRRGQGRRGQAGQGQGRGRQGRGRGNQDQPTDTASEPQAQAVRQVSGGGARGSSMGGRGGLTALLHASRQGHIAAATLLLDAGADINQVHGGDQSSPLMIATINGHSDLAMILLERGADPNLANNVGATPLYGCINVQWAPTAFYPQPSTKQEVTTHLELMQALLEHGADPNAQLTDKVWYTGYNFDQSGENETGATAFWRAAQSGDLEALKLLAGHGADPKLSNQVTRSFRNRGRRGGRGDEEETDAESSEAEQVAQQALEERREALGDDHPATLASIHGLGVLLHRLGKLDAAEPYSREALEGRRRVFGDDHPATLASIQQMGVLLDAQGNTGVAVVFYREALEGRARAFGDDDPDGQDLAAALARAEENIAQAEERDQKSVSEESAAELKGEDPTPETEEREIPDLGPPIPVGDPATSALHMAAGAGYDGNFHVAAPYGRLPAVTYLVEALGFDVNGRDFRGYTPLHHAAFRGDNEMILFLVGKGADPLAIARSGQTTVDMANGPIQRLQPFEDTIALLEGMGAKNNHRAVSR